ncbi:MAG: O-methyltransferase [Gammaproteobacteria bacterium]|nr:O-methyltransferase [Gammaproteobacteria bacterium]
MITAPFIEAYCQNQTQSDSALLAEIRATTQASFNNAQMLCDLLVGRLLQFLIRLMQAKCVVDLGTFTGYSALSMAEALPSEGRIVTCDKDPHVLAIAASFFARSPCSAQIQVFQGEVSACIASIQQKIDLVFIDADKMQIDHYYESILPKMRSGGVIVVDDVLWRGEVLAPKEKRAIAVDHFNDKIKKDPRILNVLLPIRHGLNIIVKL